jgi:hypothetical protein
MTSLRIDAARSTAGGDRSIARRRTGLRGLLLAGACATAGLLAAPANAQNLMITTTGTIAAGGTDPSNIFGAGANLGGDSYTMLVEYDALGAFYDPTGTVATDIGDQLTGYVTVSINGGPAVTTDFLTNTQPTLAEDQFSFYDTNAGNDAAGDDILVSQDVVAGNPFVPTPDLMTDFEYALQSGDLGQDIYYFQNLGDTVSASFTGTTTSIELQVPEPESWLLMATGLLGLGLLVRRSRA